MYLEHGSQTELVAVWVGADDEGQSGLATNAAHESSAECFHLLQSTLHVTYFDVEMKAVL